jgi:hypothetical protein
MANRMGVDGGSGAERYNTARNDSSCWGDRRTAASGKKKDSKKECRHGDIISCTGIWEPISFEFCAILAVRVPLFFNGE